MTCVLSEPTVLFEDNNSCIAQTENPLHHKRTKHIDVYYHFTRQMVAEGVIKLDKVDTGDQLADMLTKPLVRPVFEKHLMSLHMRNTALYGNKEVSPMRVNFASEVDVADTQGKSVAYASSH